MTDKAPPKDPPKNPPKDPPTLKDARVAADDAISRIARSANPEWTGLMYRIGVRIAHHMPYFTTNQMFDVLEQFDPDRVPYIHDRRALGPVMRNLNKDGVCVSTQQYQPATRRHCAPLLVWKSLIYVKPMLMLPPC
jgi:hypothetical protein